VNRILVWDAPNMDMCLSEFYGRIPVGPERPSMGQLMHWLAQRCGEEDSPVACVFVNVATNRPTNPRFHNWLRYLSTQGFFVFAKPKVEDNNGDIDDEMLQFIQQHRGEDLREVIIASHDAQCFKEITPELLQDGVDVLVLGFSELSNGWEEPMMRQFMDLQAIPGIFEQSPPRHINIWTLPAEGELFAPSGKPRPQPRKTPHRAKRVSPQKSASSLPTQPEAPA
jgi:uncharacterized protein